jgi:hypothetical protein
VGLARWSIKLQRSVKKSETGIKVWLTCDETSEKIGHTLEGYSFPELGADYDRIALMVWLNDLQEELFG